MKLLKHPRMTDVAMLVLKSFFVSQRGTYKLKVRWMRIVTGVPEDLGVQENLEITSEKMKEFKCWE